MSARRTRPVACATLLAAILLGACRHSVSLPDAAPTADRFFAALGQRDAGALADMLVPSERTRWSAPRLRHLLHALVLEGSLLDVKAQRDGPPQQAHTMPEPTPSRAPTATVPYAITYRSRAAARPATLHGRLALRFDARRKRWWVRFGRNVLFPGMPDAWGLDASFRWPRRGRILDRHGRVLAAGSGDHRHYPFGSLAGSTIGTMAPVTRATLRDHPEHDVGDLVGGSGLEAGLEPMLAGKPAGRLEVVARSGRVLRVLGRRHAHPGRDERTTLDVGIERVATEAMGSQPGAAVVLDPHTGAILAAVASSPIDPNDYVGVPGVKPFNRAFAGLYPPGSSFKVVTSTAALDTGVVTPRTMLTGPVDFRGVRNFHNEHFAHLTFAQALEFSVNTAFAQVALKLGGKRFYHYAQLFGFNHPEHLPVETATSSFPRITNDYELMYSAFGQAAVVATPLEMATVIATVADHGVRVDPRLVESVRPRGHRVMKRSTAGTLTRLLELVVRGGTGTAAQIPGVTVAGKTGTAEVDTPQGRKDHAWFIAFAPARHPKLAVSVVVEYGGVGGEVAAPIARNILERALPLAGGRG